MLLILILYVDGVLYKMGCKDHGDVTMDKKFIIFLILIYEFLPLRALNIRGGVVWEKKIFINNIYPTFRLILFM